MQEPPRFPQQPRLPKFQQPKFERRRTFREKPWMYRHSTLFVTLATIIGCSFTLSPLIYSLTHTEEEQNELKAIMGMRVVPER